MNIKLVLKEKSHINHCVNLTHDRLEGQQTGLLHIIFTINLGSFHKALPDCVNGLVAKNNFIIFNIFNIRIVGGYILLKSRQLPN